MIENIESIVSIIPTGVIVVDKNRQIKYMNPYARDTIIGNDAYEKDISVFHTESEIKRIESFFSSLSDNKSVELPIVKIINFKGKESLYMVKLTKIYDKNNNFSGVVVIFYDMSSFALSKVRGKDNAVHTVIRKLPVLDNEKVVFLNTDEIVFIRSLGSACLLFDRKGSRYYSNLKISELEHSLENKGFFRSHKSYLVNLSYLKEMHCKNGQCKLLLYAEKIFFVPISRRSRHKLTEALSLI